MRKLKATTKLKKFIEKLYVNRYNMPKPKITTVKDGVYIHGIEISEGMPKCLSKIFVNVEDLAYKKLMINYIENCDDRVIHLLEDK